MLKQRIIKLAVAVVAIASALGITGLGAGATMAHAASSDPGTAISAAQTVTFRICLLNASSLCLASNGAGNQVTIKSSDYAVFHFAANHGGEYQLENAAGNCLRAGDGNVVKLQNGPCVSTFANDSWKTGPRSQYQVVSVGRDQEMYTKGDQDGRDVWWGSGAWWQWAAFS